MNHTIRTPRPTAINPETRNWLSGIFGSISAMRFKAEGASAYTSPSMIMKNAIPVRKSAMPQFAVDGVVAVPLVVPAAAPEVPGAVPAASSK